MSRHNNDDCEIYKKKKENAARNNMISNGKKWTDESAIEIFVLGPWKATQWLG